MGCGEAPKPENSQETRVWQDRDRSRGEARPRAVCRHKYAGASKFVDGRSSWWRAEWSSLKHEATVLIHGTGKQFNSRRSVCYYRTRCDNSSSKHNPLCRVNERMNYLSLTRWLEVYMYSAAPYSALPASHLAAVRGLHMLMQHESLTYPSTLP